MNIQFEQLLNLAALEVNHIHIEEATIHIYCQAKFDAGFCPHCLTKNTKVNQTYQRQIRDLPIMGKKVILHLTSRQFVCPLCSRYYYESFDFVESSETVTNRYATSIFKLCQGIELQHIVGIEDLCWQTVNRIVYKYGTRQLKQERPFAQVKRIGIDEIALKKGHKHYVAVIVDLDTGSVLDLLEDRSKEFIISYFEQKGPAFCQQIELFCADLWEGYLTAARCVFPTAIIVTDRFHFFAKLQQAVDACRKYYRKKYATAKELVHLKWLLLKNEADLTPEERQQLAHVFSNPAYVLLKRCYEAKNSFRIILEEDITRTEAENKIATWITEITQTPNRFLTNFIAFYQRWATYILNYFEGRYHTSIIEGINNKIKSIKRRAFGFTNFEFFKIRVITAFK